MRHCRLVAKLPGHVGRYTWTVHDFKEAGPKYRLIIENIVKKKIYICSNINYRWVAAKAKIAVFIFLNNH